MRSFAAGTFGEKSSIERYFLTVGIETLSCLEISLRVSPLARLLLILRIVGMSSIFLSWPFFEGLISTLKIANRLLGMPLP